MTRFASRKVQQAAAAIIEKLEARALMAAGQLDATFGSGGVAIKQINQYSSVFHDVVVQSDGKILAVGTSHSGTSGSESDYLLTRSNANGSPDLTFGNHGTVISSFDYVEEGEAAAIAPDGKIYLAGSSNGFALMRYLPSGALDTGFGEGGRLLITPGPPASEFVYYGCKDIALQADGKIVLGGAYADHGQSVFVAVRVNTDGTLDNSFGDGGKVIVSIDASVSVEAVGIAPDGKIVLGGAAGIGGFAMPAMVRLNTDGSLDTTFGTGGASVLDYRDLTGNSSLIIHDLIVQSNGKIVASGESSIGLVVVRFDIAGMADATFGSNGLSAMSARGATVSVANAVAQQADGRILVAGMSANKIAVARFDYNGVVDQSWGIYGLAVLEQVVEPNGTAGYAYACAIQGDGNIVLAGNSDQMRNAALVRYLRGDLTTLPPDAYLAQNGTLSVTGSSGNDYIELSLYQDEMWGLMLKVTINGVANPPIDAFFVQRMIIETGSGDDVVVLGENIGSKQFFNVGQWDIGALINGGEGNDRLVGGDYNDTINGNAGKDRIDGGLGEDRVAGNGGNDAITGYLGRDRLYGDNGNDRLEAGNDADKIYGGDGDDLIGGGAGSDSIYGGAGTDTINGGSGGGTDRVYDAWNNEYITGVHIVYVNPIVLSDPSTNKELDALLA